MLVEGNYIGTDPTGTDAIANEYGIGVYTPGNTIGGVGYSGYVSLPDGILTNTTSLTV